MCNHYLKNTAVLSWATTRFPDATLPPDFPEHPEHTWPKSQAPVLLQTERGREMASLRWGVRVEVRGTSKLLTKYVTNARDDKLSGFTWRFLAAERRCLVPATAYFEPDGPEGQKWEVRFSLPQRPNFFFAGLWDTDPDRVTRSFTIVTTGPNALAAKIHDRMPLVLDDAGAAAWLGHRPLPADELRALCRPYPDEQMMNVVLPPPERAIRKADLKPDDQQLLF